ENHSFDSIFAMSGIPGIKAATTADFNTYDGNSYYVTSGAPSSMPTDPPHEFPDVVNQLCGQDATYPSGGLYPAMNNSGFAYAYATSGDESTGTPSPSQIGDIMACFATPSQ